MVATLAACGGGDDESGQTTTTADAVEESSEPKPGATSTTTEVTVDGPPFSGGGEGTGTATIGDSTLEFSMEGGGTCLLDANDAGLQFWVILFGTDDTGRPVTLNMSGPPSGGESVVQVGSQNLEFERWTADSGVYSRLASIEGMPEGVGATAQVDGNTISGSGVFYDDKALNDARPTGSPYEAGVLEGTFSVTCPSE